MGRPVRRHVSKNRKNRRVNNSHHSNRQMLPSPTSKQIQVTVTTKLAPPITITTVLNLMTMQRNKSKITTQRGGTSSHESQRSLVGTLPPSNSSKWPGKSPLAASRAVLVHPPAPKRPIEKLIYLSIKAY